MPLYKLHYHELGTQQYPIPVLRNGKVCFLASDETKITIPTYREDSTDEIYGRLMRDCVPDIGMLPIFEEMLLRMDPYRTSSEIKSYNYQILGTPGGGKTFLMKQIGALVHPKGAIHVECKRVQNPEEIYKQTTFNIDGEKKRGLIDARIQLGNENPEEGLAPKTIAYLRQKFGADIVMQEERDGKVITAIDWNGIDKSSDYINEVLNQVVKMEKIEVKESHNDMGFVIKKGPLLEALDPSSVNYGRIVLLDESNRMPELYDILSFFSDANVDKITLKGENDKDVTIHRRDLPPTFMLYETGNDAMDGMGDDINVMSKPALSRKASGIDVQTIPVPSQDDYIARTAKHLTGIPAMQIYKAAPEWFDEHPQEMVDFMMKIRTYGLSKEEIKEIPTSQLINIRNFSKIKDVCACYGALMYQADRLIKTELANEESNLPDKYKDYLETKALVDLRYVFKLLQHSEILRPQVQQGQNDADLKNILKAMSNQAFNKTNVDDNREEMQEMRKYRIMFDRGILLENEIADRLHDLFLPANLDILLDENNRSEGRNAVNELWSSLVRFAKENNFAFAGYEGADSVANLYNVDKTDIPEYTATKARNVLARSLEEHYKKDLGGEKISDDMLPASSVLELIQELTAHGNRGIIVSNLNVDEVMDEPLKRVYVASDQLSEQMPVNPDKLITANQFADSFILPKVRETNIKSLWSDSANASLASSNELPEAAIHAELIATGRDDKVATTSVLVAVPLDPTDQQGEKRVGTAHIIYSKEMDRTIIMSDFDISNEDVLDLKDTNTLFVNIAKNPLAPHRIENAVKKLFPDKELRQDVINSLILRNNPKLLDGMENSASDLCKFLKSMSLNGNLPFKASHLTNISYRETNTPEQLLSIYNPREGGRK